MQDPFTVHELPFTGIEQCDHKLSSFMEDTLFEIILFIS